MIPRDKIKAYALKNALAYKGKANPGAVISALFNEGLEKSQVKDIMPDVKQVVAEVSGLSLEEQEKQFKELEDLVSEREQREGLPELPLTKKQEKKGVVMRFAPSASGDLHVIHGLNAALSFDYVKRYGGAFYIRIEDTNPENIDSDAYEMIYDDAMWLTKKEAEVVIQSDRMKLYYDYMDKLVGKFKAYVCNCPPEKFKEYVKNKKDCPCRNLFQKEQLSRLGKMFDVYNEGEAVLRFKTPKNFGGMEHKNPALRDFPLARINETKHPRQGNKYRVWPLMNLAVSVDDIEMGMTHIIRGKDHRDNAERQKMIFEVLDKEYPWTAFLGRYHFKDMVLSTSEFRKGIKEGKYSGWDDPKLPTIQALKKKYSPEAFWKMAEHIGLSEVDKTLDKNEFFRILDDFNSD